MSLVGGEMKTSRFLAIGAALSLVLMLVACGGGSSSSGSGIPTVVSVAITPPASGTAFNLNGQATFSATVTVTNGASTAVTWSVQEGATGGSINSAGVYTAPSAITGTSASFHIVATAQADTTKTASVAVTVSLGANPTFTSTPPASVVGGTPYTYVVAATVAPASSITYALTQKPTGASLSGATLSWTPSASQTNVANSFTITATTLAGGTATQVWTVTPSVPPLVITNTPGLTASVGSAYTYAVAASDVSGSVITFVFTGPAAATHSGNTISWTPAPADGRTLDNFSVTATSNYGGTASKSWTVNCAGPVTVNAADFYWSMDGTYTPVAPSAVIGYDLSDVKAFVPNANGTVTTFSGIDNGGGTATIANVPAGKYWLQVTRGEWFWTNTNSFAYGVDYIGRWSASTVTGVTLNWQLTGLSAWQAEDALSFYAPNAGVSAWPPSSACLSAEPIGSTTFQNCDLDPYANYPVDFSLGDVSYFLQTNTDSVSDSTVVLAMGNSNSLALLNNAGDISVASSLAANTGNLWELNLSGTSAWTSYAPMVNPTFAFTGSQGHADFYIQQQTQVPNVLAQTQSVGPAPNAVPSAGMVPILDYPVTAPTATQNLGQFHDYSNNFFGPFSTLFEYQVNEPAFLVPTTSLTVPVGIGHIGATIPTNATPDVPVMSPVAAPTITSSAASGSLFTTAVASEAITLNWTAPTGSLTPIGYEVTVTPVLAADATFFLYTDAPPFIIPAGLLTNGHQYAFTIRAVSDGSANFTSSPFHSSFPVAWADAVSGAVTYSTAATPISLAIPAGPTARTTPAVPSRPGLRLYAPPVSPLAQPVARSAR